jgi:hypothetical protein
VIKRTLLAVGVALFFSMMFVPTPHGTNDPAVLRYPFYSDKIHGVAWDYMILQTVVSVAAAVIAVNIRWLPGKKNPRERDQ